MKNASDTNSKRYFLFSLALNALLAGAVIFFLVFGSSQEPASGSKSADGNNANGAGAQGAMFQWSKLESDDYPAYIRNLRAVGCPEQTVRDIILAEINGVYTAKIADLRSRSLTESQQELAREDLKKEEARLWTYLFPPPQSTATATNATNKSASASMTTNTVSSNNPALANQDSASDNATDPPAQSGAVSIPLALLDPGAALQSDEFQFGAWLQLQDKFVNAVGGENQNPNDPAYRARWIKAQEDLDEAFHSKFGDEAYNELLQKRKVGVKAPTSTPAP